MAVKRILFSLFLLCVSVHSFGQQNNAADTLYYQTTLTPVNNSPTPFVSYQTSIQKLLYKTAFLPDSMLNYPSRIKLIVEYSIDSTCAISNLKTNLKGYGYLERTIINRIKNVIHVMVINGQARNNCNEIATTFTPVKIPITFRTF